MQKVAFLTMDVESFYDTTPIRDKKIPIDERYTCAEQVKVYTELAEKYGARCSLFVTAEFIPYVSPYVKQAAQRGHGIDLHCYRHVAPLLQSMDEYKSDISNAIEILKKEFGVKPLGYRAPCFAMDDERFEVIHQNGFVFDSSVNGFATAANCKSVDLSQYKKINDVVYEKDGFYELRPCVGDFCGVPFPAGGGAYIRMAPWFFAKAVVKKFLRKHDAYMFYVHPFEICKTKLPLAKELTAKDKNFVRTGRKSYLKRIEWIIKRLKKEGFEIISIEEFIKRQKNGGM